MLGSSSVEAAQEEIKRIFNDRKSQIKHLHIHENDLIWDTHNPPDRVITLELLEQITERRTYIFEK